MAKLILLIRYTLDKNVRGNWRTELLLIKQRPAAGESHCCLGTRFTQRWGTTPFCIWGHIQDEVKARLIIQDLMKRNKRKSAGSARKGKKAWPWPQFLTGSTSNCLDLHNWRQVIRPPISKSSSQKNKTNKFPQEWDEEWSSFKPRNARYLTALKSYHKGGRGLEEGSLSVSDK